MKADNHIKSIREMLALGALGIAGNIAVFILPVIVGALVDYGGFSIQHASYIASADMFGLGIGTLAWSRFIQNSNWRTFALVSAILLFLGNVLCAMTDTFVAVAVSRFVAGVGAGLMLTIGVSGLSQTANPDRVLGIFGVSVTATASICLFGFPHLLVLAGSEGLFFALAGFAVLGAVSCSTIPQHSLVTSVVASNNQSESSHAQTVSVLTRVVTLFAVFLVFFCMSLFLVYLERVGVSNGFDVSQISVGLGSAQFTGVLGALTAAVIATRLGNRIVPMMFAIALPVIGAITIATTTSFVPFVLAASALIYSWSMLYPYVIGVMISLDETAKLVTYALVAMTFSKSLSPTFGSFLVTETEFALAYWFCAIGFFCSAVMFLPSIAITDREMADRPQLQTSPQSS